MTKIHFPQFSREEYSPFEMRQLVQVLELRFQQLESNASTSLPTVEDDAGEFAPLVHTHREADIDDLSHVSSIFELTDVNAGFSEGQTLVWDQSAGAFVAGDAGSGGVTTLSLDDLTDVSVQSFSSGDVLTYNGTTGLWEPAPVDSGGGTGVDTLLELIDTSVVNRGRGDFLWYNGPSWEPTGQNLRWNPDFNRFELGFGVGVNWDDDAGTNVENLIFGPYNETGLTVDPDPDLGNVTFLASFEDGTVGSEQYTPEIGPALHWTIASGSQPGQVDGEISDTQSTRGTKSLYFKDTAGGPSAGWSSTVKTTGAQYGFTGDFTIEADFYVVTPYTVSPVPVVASWDKGTNGKRQWTLEMGYNSGTFEGTFLISTTGLNEVSIFGQHTWSGSGASANTWHHIAVTRQGNDYRIFLDGVVSDQGVTTNASTIFVPTEAWFLIGQNGPGEGAPGTVEAYFDNIRITDGVARYTTGFTAPTNPYEGTDFPKAFIVGDPLYPTVVDGSLTTVTGDFTVNGAVQLDTTLNVTGASTFGGISDFNANVDINNAVLSIFDTSGADSAAFSHDGTDFNTVFTGTADWNLTGANLSSDSALISQTYIQSGVYTSATKPAPGTAGRIIFNSDYQRPIFDDGTFWRFADGEYVDPVAEGAVIIDELTASGLAAAGRLANGAISLEVLTASGVAEIISGSTGAVILEEITASGTATKI